MNKKKRFPLVLVTLILFFQSLIGITALAADDFSVNANAGYAIDADSGKVFFNQDGDTPKGIASITKTISAYLVLEAIKQQKISWEQEVSISEYAEKLSTVPDLSNVPLVRGQKYTVRDLFESMIVQSANASAVALAELVAGNEHTFVNQMREQLTKWEIKDATIINASGLSNVYLGEHKYPGTQENDENLMSARDVAIVAQHLIKDFPEVLEVSKIKEKTFAPNTSQPDDMKNWNVMLYEGPNYKEGVDGLKTGTTDLAGACFVGTIQKDGRRVITVILNALDQPNDENARFVETGKLMDYCLNNWSQQDVTVAGQTPSDQKTLKVTEGKEKSVALAMEKPVNLWVRSDMDPKQLTIKTTLDHSLLDSNAIIAPVHKNEKIGTVSVSLAQDNLGYVQKTEGATTDLVTKNAVEKASAFELIWQRITNLFA
ncbi:MAG: D-alanyl-D-alanine carboxypeptidase [Enterococcus sp.]|uniref:serine hydrolase n=1 Tax=Enterococcus sp. TaxID=35783 RepID=UPI00264834CA|nr:serine hydrolase [Enterococcus sp.]MDN6002864.1 D-alanyl-D-alanine carboxypeptidase [Enterococcus sp.]MDN6217014.1 D-alanyl-D-alanine carboxypeptidase [Enterococcus sp.]MDN6517043.1 D-alanyl-D-alanine carboxypeptidase [Enterococcus sp.]MDN6561483.1 D-alanyl-D-alanine carboxypeptidase [Enterococcus sp.]MDN6584362.1 D-alanyl-D-alanine carboxypeptidase [Enterococcus sp.]